MAPTWYLGPPGDLRALICPEVDIDMTVERYGGVFQGLSGARSMDVTGHKQKFAFNFKWLDIEEYRWFEALHLRQLPGPYRLINPFKKNRLTPEGSMVKWGSGTAVGAAVTSGVMTQVYDWPTGIGLNTGMASKWTNRTTAGSTLRIDNKNKITASAGETITGSIYLKTNVAFSPNFVIDWWSRTAQIGSTSVTVAPVTTSWNRFTVTGTAPAGTVRAQMAIYTSNLTSELSMAAAQFEIGSSATDWEMGGGSPLVFIDQMPTNSHRFPLRDVTLTILEA